jgi:hypothetical protein
VSRLVILAALAVTASVAAAAPKRKVRIETEPPNATVYFENKEDGPVCTTPCTTEAPVGDTAIIIELEGHKQLFENLSVPAKKAVVAKFKLVRAIGTVIVKGPSGAQITIDDIDKGKAPTRFEMPAGAYTVVLTLNGKKVGTEFVEVAANDEVTVDKTGAKPTKEPVAVAPDPEEDEVEEGTNGGGGGDTTEVSSSTEVGVETPQRGPYISLAVAMDVGFRNFEYDNPQTANLTPEKEGGQVMIGPVVEIWPTTLFGSRLLPGLSLFSRFGYGVNQQQVKQKMSGATTDAKTFWRVFELSAKYHFVIKQKLGLELGAGFVQDQYQFTGDSDDIKLVPDAKYQNIRFGARVNMVGETFEPYLALENRIVLSGGALQERFTSASANGYRAAAGVIAKFGGLSARVEGAINYYAWSFDNTDVMPEFNADGGTDSIKFITAAIGYAY